MAIDGGEVVFSFTGDTSDLAAALGKAQKGLDSATEAAQGTANTIGKMLAPAQEKATKITKKSRQGIKDFADTAGDADSSLMGVAGALDLINPAMGDMARVTGDGLAAIEGVSKAAFFTNPVFLGLAAAAGAVALAYTSFTAETEAAAAAQEVAKKRADDLKDSYNTLGDFLLETALDYAVYNGTLDDTEAAIRRAAIATKKLYTPVIESHTKEVERLTGAIAEQIKKETKAKDLAEKQIDFYTRLGHSKQEVADLTFTLTDAAEQETIARKELQSQFAAEHRALKVQEGDLERVTQIKSEMIEGEETRAAAIEASTTATEEETAALDKLAEMEDKLALARATTTEKLGIANADQITAITELMIAEKDNQEVQTRGLALIEEITDHTQEQIEANQELADSKALEKVAADLDKIAAVEAAINKERAEGLDAIALWEAEQIAAIEEVSSAYEEGSQVYIDAEEAKTAVAKAATAKRAALTEEEIEKQRELTTQPLTALEGLARASGDAISFLMERQLEETGRVEMALYRLSQSAALADIAFSATKGYMEAGVVSAVNPVAGAIMYTAISIAAAAATAAILATPAPSYHSGGIIGEGAPDEVTLVRGEGVVNTLGMGSLGAEGLASLNRGAGANTVIVQRFKHKVLDVVVADSLQRNSPLRRAIRGDRPRGILPRRRG